MIRVEIYAVQHARRFELEIDENMCSDELCCYIKTVLGEMNTDAKQNDVLISCYPKGIVPCGTGLCECGIVNGSVLIYILESNVVIKEVGSGEAG